MPSPIVGASARIASKPISAVEVESDPSCPLISEARVTTKDPGPGRPVSHAGGSTSEGGSCAGLWGRPSEQPGDGHRPVVQPDCQEWGQRTSTLTRGQS